MPSVNTSFAKLGRDTSLYALVFGLQRLVGFAMLPVYTRHLRPADYGAMQLLDMAVDVAAILFTAGMSSGVQRLLIRAPDEEMRGRVISTAYVVEVGLSLVGALLMLGFAPQLQQLSHGGVATVRLVQIAAVNFWLSTLLAVPLQVMQSQQRSGLVLLVAASKLLMQVGLNVWLLVIRDMGVIGILYSTMITNALIGGVLAVWMIRTGGTRIDSAVLGDLIRFGLPIQLTTAGEFILTWGDRFFLLQYHGPAEVGLYGLSYQFGFLLGQVSGQPFLSAWNPHRHQIALEDPASRDVRFARGFLYFNLFVITVAVGICCLVRPMLGIMAPLEFQAAVRLVPVIVLAYVVQWWIYAVGFGLEVTARTVELAKASAITVVVVVTLYWALIPDYGAAGAAAATLISFVLRFLLVFRRAQQVYPVRYDWRPALQLVVIGGTTVGAVIWFATGGIVADLLIGLTGVGAYLVAAWRFVLDGEQRQALLLAVREPRKLTAALASE